ncbi:nuclear transport factor 2 family protein [Devosia ginsengisoli]|uniref:nuclear transport factor 2 family protein n=1 Tax=Devosia ginsengisoli TaxID=400770 RepID=UPI0026F21EF4|nr:nuclear transport factor 2 family protein [Devosia ginsengisoli]MCR6672127.1 nuclear transport factor 2 family protein [Devosia ginsengisoli]
MSQFDPATLPAPLAAYFAATDHRDTASLFAPGAVVRDEGETLTTVAAIAAWLDRVETRYHPRYVVEAAETTGDRTIVTFVVSGTFPGSPATLRQAFVVGDGLIRWLETL